MGPYCMQYRQQTKKQTTKSCQARKGLKTGLYLPFYRRKTSSKTQTAMNKLCPCIKGGEVGPMTLFEQVTAQKKFFNADMRCEFAGNQIVMKVDAGEITVKEAIEDCVTFAMKIKDKGKDQHMLAWLCMHLALGLCHKFDLQDKQFIRNVMAQIIPFSRGLDMGLFYRDLSAFGDDGQYLDRQERELLEKAMYYLKLSAGFKVDLKTNDLGRKIYGAMKPTFPDTMLFIDLPIGNPAYAIGTAPPSISNPLMTACENMKPWVVLHLLRHGATAHGEPLNFILASLSHVKTLQDATQSKLTSDNPIKVTQVILSYLLRTVTQLKLVFDDQKIGDMQHDSDVYYVSKNVTNFLDNDCYASPNKLGQLCRVKIRSLLLDNDKIPDTIYKLPRPLITTHKRYLDLLT